MIKLIELILPPEQAADKQRQLELSAHILSVAAERITFIKISRRSIDARSKDVKIKLQAEVYIDEQPPPPIDFEKLFNFKQNVSTAKPILIIGCGPAGMFAALRLIELGLKPVIIERGKDVKSRRRDLAAINKSGIVNPDSNYCFGEGGAGTYSDGKLYTRATKRGDIQRILKIFVMHGAEESILIDAHPHIGTNKLPAVVENIRQTILNAGGEIHFNTRLKDFIVHENTIKGIVTEGSEKEQEFLSSSLILATGHSARDIFFLLQKRKILIEAKPFALGVRMEHPQEIIDTMQYHRPDRAAYLPPASYSVSCQVGNKGVYSFCMCPGGIIAPAATDKNEIVVNGWSPSKRNNPFANSGLVVETPKQGDHELSGLYYQMEIEQACFKAGGGELRAPAQRLIDFVEGKFSANLPNCSYIPGLTSVNLNLVLPQEISSPLKQALGQLRRDNQKKNLYTNEAVLVATESRTSSPVRIPRDKESLQHIQIAGLFPCGEGAGYAGGIVSAAMDGERCAEAVCKIL